MYFYLRIVGRIEDKDAMIRRLVWIDFFYGIWFVFSVCKMYYNGVNEE